MATPRKGLLLWLVPVLGFLLVVGCDPVTPEQAVKTRAEARWSVLMSRNFESAYEFESPAYREVVTYERYRARFGDAAVWHGAEVTSVVLGERGDVADVVLTLDYTSMLPTGESYKGRRGIQERWVLSAGEWWILTE